MNSIGIMQGRLSPSRAGRLQFFPLDWEAEFPLAKKLGFNHLQWFLDRSEAGIDPIRDRWLNPDFLKKLDRSRRFLPISSIDGGKYFWFGPESRETLAVFRDLLPPAAGRLSAGLVSIPLLKQTAPKTETEKASAGGNIKTLAEAARPLKLKLALETELPAAELVKFIDALNLPNVGVGYDLGNRTFSGVDCPAEIRVLGSRIMEVHLKDARRSGEASVLLGTGDADLSGCFKALAEIGYNGVYTLQAWRGENYLADAAGQLALVQKLLS